MKDIINELHNCYAQLNEKIFNDELPKKVIFTISNKEKCTSKEFWKEDKDLFYQLDISTVSFSEGRNELLMCLVRQMIHLHCKLKHIKDVLKGENTELYVLECEKFGIYSQEPNEELQNVLDNLELNEDIFKLRPIKEPKERKMPNRKPVYTYICYGCGKEIKTDVEELKAECKECNTEFELK